MTALHGSPGNEAINFVDPKLHATWISDHIAWFFGKNMTNSYPQNYPLLYSHKQYQSCSLCHRLPL